MRTTVSEHVSDGRDGVQGEEEPRRDNPRRRREPYNEREAEEPHGGGMGRSPRSA